MAKSRKNQLLDLGNSLDQGLIKLVIIGAIIFFLYRFVTTFLPKKLQEIRKANTEAKDGKNIVTNAGGNEVDLNTIAEMWWSGFNPSGMPSLFYWDGTEESLVMQAAKMSAGIFDKVAAVYATLHPGSRLLEDMASELDADELNQARTLAQLS
ncbi:MAG: hypothetical protein AAF599_00040 [Bacteroidota bacterium]